METTSTNNLALITRLYSAFRARDYEAFRQICAPEIVWIQNPGFPGGGTHHGAEAVIENVFKTFRNAWDNWKFEIDESLDAGTAVVVLGKYTAVHKASGKEMTAQAAHVYDIKNGKVSRFRQFADTWAIVQAMG